jgi:hydrogenase maturation protease
LYVIEPGDGVPGATPPRVVIVGCEPACAGEGGLSRPVARAVEAAVRLVLRLLTEAAQASAPHGTERRAG